MSATSSIEWTDKSWNPIRGCSIVSPGCVNCYAMKQAHRFSGVGKPFEGLTKLTKAGPQWTGVVRPAGTLSEPLHWRKPQRVFVNSMSDLFHEDVPFEFVDKVFAVMALAPRHTFQILTKRPKRMLDYFTTSMGVGESRRSRVIGVAWEMLGQPSLRKYRHEGIVHRPWPLPNVWLGVSVEDQQRADERIPLLLQTPAAVRFLSCEPLLGPITILREWRGLGHRFAAQADDDAVCCCGRARAYHVGVDWVIVGGESGPGARPFEVQWAESILKQCAAAGVPAFLKQLGSVPLVPAARLRHWEWGGEIRSDREAKFLDYQATTVGDRTWRVVLDDRKGGDPSEWPQELRVRQFPEVRA